MNMSEAGKRGGYEPCYCLCLPENLRGKFRCNACVNNIIEDKNTLVKELQSCLCTAKKMDTGT